VKRTLEPLVSILLKNFQWKMFQPISKLCL
jgi:hypothetical protein